MKEESTKQQFYSIFLDRLRELYSGEQQLIDILPGLFASVFSEELRKSFEKKFQNTQGHRKKIEELTASLNEDPEGVFSESMSSMIQECKYLQRKPLPDVVKEAALISALQKILHYQIAGYGALKTFARHLGFEEVYRGLKQILDEKANLDSELTLIAEGSYFRNGINQKAAQ